MYPLCPNKSPVSDCIIDWLKDLNDVISTFKERSSQIFALCVTWINTLAEMKFEWKGVPNWGVSLNSIAPDEYRTMTRRVKESCWIPAHQSALHPPENSIIEEWLRLFQRFRINSSDPSTVTYFPSTSTLHWNICHDRSAIRRKIRDTQHPKLADSVLPWENHH